MPAITAMWAPRVTRHSDVCCVSQSESLISPQLRVYTDWEEGLGLHKQFCLNSPLVFLSRTRQGEEGSIFLCNDHSNVARAGVRGHWPVICVLPPPQQSEESGRDDQEVSLVGGQSTAWSWLSVVREPDSPMSAQSSILISFRNKFLSPANHGWIHSDLTDWQLSPHHSDLNWDMKRESRQGSLIETCQAVVISSWLDSRAGLWPPCYKISSSPTNPWY